MNAALTPALDRQKSKGEPLMKKGIPVLSVLSLVFVFLMPSAHAEGFQRYDHFPSSDRYGVVGAALPDGSLLLWNGEEVYVQQGLRVDGFALRGQGYSGDPAFLAVSPGGQTALLGAGGWGTDPWVDRIYRYTPGAPGDFTPDAIVAVMPHYAAAFLTEDLVAIDAGAGDWMNSVIVVHDLRGGKSLPAPVLYKPASPKGDTVVQKPGYSAALTVDHARGRLYAMDAATLELRAFSVSALIDAYESSGLLDWAGDGMLIGTPGAYYNGGVNGVTPEGGLVISGALGWGMPGGIQIVDPDTGTVLENLDPSGAYSYASAIYNPVTGQITAMADGLAYATGGFITLPAMGLAGMAMLAALLAAAARRRA